LVSSVPSHIFFGVPSGKRTNSYGKSLFLMGKTTISMAIFHGYVSLPEGKFFFVGGGWQDGYHLWGSSQQGCISC
jgi:hypothetical protein